MSSALETVLGIAGVGSLLLFTALVGLIGLMYALTSPWLYDRLAPSPTDDAAVAAGTRAREAAERARLEAEAESDRQQRAVALAVAIACASVDRLAPPAPDATSEWRRVHRTRRLAQARGRARVRR